jgi:hypothetical protein
MAYTDGEVVKAMVARGLACGVPICGTGWPSIEAYCDAWGQWNKHFMKKFQGLSYDQCERCRLLLGDEDDVFLANVTPEDLDKIRSESMLD